MTSVRSLGQAAMVAEIAVHRLAREGARARVRLDTGSRAPTATDLNNEVVRGAATKLGVEVDVLPAGFLRLTYRGRAFYSHGSDFPFERLIPWRVCGDKLMTSMILADRRLPIPASRSFRLNEYAAAHGYFREIAHPVVVKPTRGTSGGQAVSLGITAGRALRRAFAKAAAVGGEVLVESQVPGDHVRVTILDGEVLGTVRRVPAHVVGTGGDSIAALVTAKNDRWRTGDPDNRLLMPLRIDRELRRSLRRKGLDLSHTPAAGEAVQLREVSNADQGGEIHDVSEVLHDDYVELALAGAGAVGPVFCGVDLIVQDLRSPARPGGVFVNEVNTTPAIYVANPLVNGGPSTYAAERALRHLFSLEG